MWRRQARSCSATRTPRCMPYMYASFHICLIPIPYTSLIYALYISRICVGEGTLDAATIDKELLIDTVSVYTYERARTHARTHAPRRRVCDDNRIFDAIQMSVVVRRRVSVLAYA